MAEEETLTIKQITRELDVDDKTVRRWIKGGQLQATRDIVGHYAISRSELNRFVTERRQKFNPQTDNEA